jgi:hypothetical protein
MWLSGPAGGHAGGPAGALCVRARLAACCAVDLLLSRGPQQHGHRATPHHAGGAGATRYRRSTARCSAVCSGVRDRPLARCYARRRQFHTLIASQSIYAS